jgi:hypothetical protein
MRKLRLDLDALAVESFDTRDDAESARGTLFAREGSTAHTDCWGLTCPGCGATALVLCTAQDCPSREVGSCDVTCETCGDSCDGWHTCYMCYTIPPSSPETCLDCPSGEHGC